MIDLQSIANGVEAFVSVQAGVWFAKSEADGLVGFVAEEGGIQKRFELYDNGGFWYLREVK